MRDGRLRKRGRKRKPIYEMWESRDRSDGKKKKIGKQESKKKGGETENMKTYKKVR